jgi:hypothetical protein
MTKSGDKVIHVEFNSTGVKHYFGSIAAIYDTFDAATIGISQQGLYDYGITPNKSYRNKVVTIYEGEIKRKKGNRRKPE